MAEFSNEERGVRFTLPDSMTVRDQLGFFAAVSNAEEISTFESYWEAAKTLIEDWECDALPDIGVDLGEVHDSKITSIILWVGTQALNHMSELGAVSKN